MADPGDTTLLIGYRTIGRMDLFPPEEVWDRIKEVRADPPPVGDGLGWEPDPRDRPDGWLDPVDAIAEAVARRRRIRLQLQAGFP